MFNCFRKVSDDNIAICSDKTNLAEEKNQVRKQLQLFEASQPRRERNNHRQYNDLQLAKIKPNGESLML